MSQLQQVSKQIEKALLQLERGHVDYAASLIRCAHRDLLVIQSADHVAQSFQAIGDAAQKAAQELDKFVAAARSVT